MKPQSGAGTKSCGNNPSCVGKNKSIVENIKGILGILDRIYRIWSVIWCIERRQLYYGNIYLHE